TNYLHFYTMHITSCVI
ncbi:hypothetical protein N499_0665, partial [Wolbachia pipientis wVitA]